MRLERLEISGFKSFSDRAELAFDSGVTAIVGPNGCGKSNVADAITWVLGEQSARSLRGEKMEDVIFSGSDARRPGGTAEVRLRLVGLQAPPRREDPEAPPLPEFGPHNGHADAAGGNGHGASQVFPGGVSSDLAGGTAVAPGAAAAVQAVGVLDLGDVVSSFTRDVEVTRRLYRSGESEYLIDGEVCRLRDIHELLMDTGLGAKAYSIIEQGKIGMILSSRPGDRRQLIEEAAGITKYKSRRRSAELKLEAAQQNLTRIDDIVFELEKQKGTLKRQAAKARRYRRLRDELRRWEKVLFAERYREFRARIERAVARLGDARQREQLAVARLSEVEAELATLRVEQLEAERRAASVREEAHARELDLGRRQQQLELNRHQLESLGSRAAEMEAEQRDMEARREPARLAVEARTQAHADAERARDDAASGLAGASDELQRAQQEIERLEGDVEAARGELFGVLNAATALRHAMESATAQRERVGATLGKLDVERDEVSRDTERVAREHAGARESLDRAHAALEAVRVQAAAKESELSSARAEHEWRARSVRTREQELAATEGRLRSLQELQASRAEFGDAARMVLVQANGHVGQQGAVADFLEVEARYERAVEACLGDVLQHIIVARHADAAAGLALVREHDAGRCGFVVVEGGAATRPAPDRSSLPAGVVEIGDVLRVSGPHADTVRAVLPEAYVAGSFAEAFDASMRTMAPVATLDGDVFRGPHLVSGGVKAEARGILSTAREVKELQERLARERDDLARVAEETAGLELVMAQATSALVAFTAEQHRQEKVVVSLDAQLTQAELEQARLARKTEVLDLERRRAEEERSGLDERYAEAQVSLTRLSGDQQQAEAQLAQAQRRLVDAREQADALSRRAAEARAGHAGLVERASALAADVVRLREEADELERRIVARAGEIASVHARRSDLTGLIDTGVRQLDDDLQQIDVLRRELQVLDDAALEVRTRGEAQDALIRSARVAVDDIRGEAGGLEVERATAETDLSHLAEACAEAVQASLDEVLADVEQLEAAGEAVPDAAALSAEEPDPELDDEAGADMPAPPVAEAVPPASMSAADAIAKLRGTIDRLGPVNMMAIEQFDELEARHGFLTTQRRDLVDSIAQTSQAIQRIDETSTARFREAFAAIQHNFQETFSTLFGGGHAGLTLIDENDPLETGIDIVASPPGKRLQSVQLLSGGEKALTAISLMFAIFKYKPSPFCLLDEIDAPLDDANVSRFVDMLRGMLDRTQFILITHNRRTMEIANRLYGVTMEEPGVSKLISVSLH
ncbi:MAG: chromosome segregation protein SMC [Vicinamibacterales bacterium]